jgi:hypothetical protein
MKFDKIAPGMVLYDVHSHKMGNTALGTIGVWKVVITEVDTERRRAMASWNGNKPQIYYEREIERLKAKAPVLIRTAFGRMRRATREELKAMKESANG